MTWKRIPSARASGFTEFDRAPKPAARAKGNRVFLTQETYSLGSRLGLGWMFPIFGYPWLCTGGSGPPVAGGAAAEAVGLGVVDEGFGRRVDRELTAENP